MDDIFDRLTKELADRYDIERQLGAGGMAWAPLHNHPRFQRLLR